MSIKTVGSSLLSSDFFVSINNDLQVTVDLLECVSPAGLRLARRMIEESSFTYSTGIQWLALYRCRLE